MERVERELSRLNGATTEALLNALIDNAPLGIAYLDRDLRFVRVNASLAAINGLPVEAHTGRTPRELLPGMPMEAIEARWRQVLETGEPLMNIEISGETPAAPGMVRCWREDWYPVRIAGEIRGLAAIVRDVTEQRRLDELQRLLVGIVGHDLRNPLSVVTMASMALLDGNDLSPRQASLAARIHRGAKGIERLAQDLLDYTAIQRGGGVPVTLQQVHLGEIVRAAADEVEAAYPGSSVSCSGANDAWGMWDPTRIQQLAGNLMANAAKYGAPGQPVRAEWRGAPDEVTFAVNNRGTPIPQERIARLFDGVWQGAPGDRRGGIGLGLFIAREIVRAHGGHIEVRSTEEDGTSVMVRLPRQPALFPERPGSEVRRQLAASPGAGKPNPQ
jgi:PAS domain S-box-containing protein